VRNILVIAESSHNALPEASDWIAFSHFRHLLPVLIVPLFRVIAFLRRLCIQEPLKFLCVVLGCSGVLHTAQAEIVLHDVLGRTVTLAQPAQRIVLAQARHFSVLALLHPDPVSVLAGWSDEFKTSFTNEYEQYRQAFPAIARVPVVGRHTADTFSVETALGLRPDLVILTAMFAGVAPGMDPRQSALIRAFEAADVPVVVIDFFVHPLQNTVPSLTLLGQALGRETQAAQVLALYQTHMDRVATRLAGRTTPPPAVFVHAHAGSTDCCNTPGVGTFNDMIRAAGGHNIGVDVVRSAMGRIEFEYINHRNPSVYVATGTGGNQRVRAGLAIGAGADPQAARTSLARIVQTQGLSSLSAVRDGKAYGIWHGFNDSPLHVVFIEALARWIDPERFDDISAQDTLDAFNAFLPVPMRGTYLTQSGAP